MANGGGFFNGLEAGSKGAPGVLTVVRGLRTGGDDEGVVGEFGAIAEDDFFCVGFEVDGFAEKDFRIFLAAKDGAKGRGNLTGRERAGRNLIEKWLEEMEVALINENDGGVNALESLRGDESAKTAAENDNFVRTGHSVIAPNGRGGGANGWRFKPTSAATI